MEILKPNNQNIYTMRKKLWERPINNGDIAVLIMVAFVIAGFIFFYTIF